MRGTGRRRARSTLIVDATALTIQGVSSTGGTYVATNVVTIIVTFDEAITVSGGVPSPH